MRILLIASLLLSSFACATAKESITETTNARLKACVVDSDCVSVADSCCGCTGGGRNMVISSKEQKNWKKIHAQACKSTICPSMMSKHASCSATPMCVKGQCELK